MSCAYSEHVSEYHRGRFESCRAATVIMGRPYRLPIAAMPRSDSSRHVAPGIIPEPASRASNARFAMDRFYEDVNSLFVRAYDAFYVGGAPIVGDVAFYERLACETGGRVLELACGTGRIALALAASGLDVTGVDISDGMLTMARCKIAGRPASVGGRLTLINQDMSQLSLGLRFGFV